MKVPVYEGRLRDGSFYLKKVSSFVADGRKAYTSPDDVAALLIDTFELDTYSEEHIFCLCLDLRGHLIGSFEVSHGAVDQSIFPIRETLVKALTLNAVRLIVAHNHPSGDPTASQPDIDSTGRFMDACRTVGISLDDHIIIGSDWKYVSLRRNGHM